MIINNSRLLGFRLVQGSPQPLRSPQEKTESSSPGLQIPRDYEDPSSCFQVLEAGWILNL